MLLTGLKTHLRFRVLTKLKRPTYYMATYLRMEITNKNRDATPLVPPGDYDAVFLRNSSLAGQAQLLSGRHIYVPIFLNRFEKILGCWRRYYVVVTQSTYAKAARKRSSISAQRQSGGQGR